MTRPLIADRVQETSGFVGTGAAILNGATSGYRSFAVGIGVGNSCYYCIENPDAGQWEVGVGVLTDASTLNRQAVLSSSTGALVSFGSGTKRVFCTLPAEGLLLDTAFTHVQEAAQAVWTVTHNLGKRPSVSVVDSAGTKVYGEIQYLSDDQLVVRFSSAFSGKAHLN